MLMFMLVLFIFTYGAYIRITERLGIFFNIGCISNGLDYNGGDIWKDRSTTAEDCGRQCKENADCGKWTFVVPGNNGTCVLKRNSSDFIIPCLECISGFRSTATTKCERHG